MVACDKPPDTPETVTVAVPVAAVLLAVSVNMLVVAVPPGLNDAVTPLGRPDADKLTLLLKPPWGVTVIVLVPLVPWTKLRLLGEEERVKSPTGLTVRVIVAVLVKVPDVPVMVTLEVPIVAVVPTLRVTVVEAGSGLELKEAVMPLGRPDAEKVTLPVKPFRGDTVIPLEPAVPCTMARPVGEAESVKPGCGVPEAQLFTKFAALTVPMPVAKSQPVEVP